LLLVGLVLCGVGATGATAIERRGETDAETDGVIVDWNTGRILPPNPPRPTEPESPDNTKPIIMVQGKPHPAFMQTTITPRINEERYIAFTLMRQRENGFPFDLTEETWAKNKTLRDGKKKKKFVSRSRLNEIKTDWEMQGLICRVSGAKNAKHEARDWNKIKDKAQGRTSPTH
jgi:hypothetical protein